jgi:hypothetical protein
MTGQAALALGDDALFVALELIHDDARQDEFEVSSLAKRCGGFEDRQLTIVLGDIEPDAGVDQQSRPSPPEADQHACRACRTASLSVQPA